MAHMMDADDDLISEGVAAKPRPVNRARRAQLGDPKRSICKASSNRPQWLMQQARPSGDRIPTGFHQAGPSQTRLFL